MLITESATQRFPDALEKKLTWETYARFRKYFIVFLVMISTYTDKSSFAKIIRDEEKIEFKVYQKTKATRKVSYYVLPITHLSRQKFPLWIFLLHFGDANVSPGSINQRNPGSFLELLS